MASENVLKKAIEALEYNTNLLLERKRKYMSGTHNEEIINEINNKINRNESMILDYQFRLKYENE